MAVLPCAQEDCRENAAFVVAESNPLDCLFKSGAGLLCEKHAEECSLAGGIPLSFDGFVEAVRSEQ